jgi:hypothetical protein
MSPFYLLLVSTKGRTVPQHSDVLEKYLRDVTEYRDEGFFLKFIWIWRQRSVPVHRKQLLWMSPEKILHWLSSEYFRLLHFVGASPFSSLVLFYGRISCFGFGQRRGESSDLIYRSFYELFQILIDHRMIIDVPSTERTVLRNKISLFVCVFVTGSKEH